MTANCLAGDSNVLGGCDTCPATSPLNFSLKDVRLRGPGVKSVFGEEAGVEQFADDTESEPCG